MKERIYGIDCEVTQEQFPDGKHSVYRFTVPGWPECVVTGGRAAKRVINGRLDTDESERYPPTVSVAGTGADAA